MVDSVSIHAIDMKKSFPIRGEQVRRQVVNGVSLHVDQGEIFGFLGPNGAGKTTCLRMLTTLLSIDSGSARIAGYDVGQQPREVRKRIGYVSQAGGADLPATGRENLMLTGRLYGLKRAHVETRIDEISRLLGLEGILDEIAGTYSGGQRRRLEIALGILHAPAVLFLDEPTTGLDIQNRTNLWAHIKTLRALGTTIFLTTHYLEEADTLADRIAIIDHGVIIAEGTPALLKQQAMERSVDLTEPTLDDVFLQLTGRYLRDEGREYG